jgi:hypothetical protein
MNVQEPDLQKTKRLRKQRWIRGIGFGLIAFMMCGVLVAIAAPVLYAARSSLHRRMLQNLRYPDIPIQLGTFPVRVEFGHATYIRTPQMPLHLAEAANRSLPELTFDLRDSIDGLVRVEPTNFVLLSVYAPPKTWVVHRGRNLTLNADSQSTTFVQQFEYDAPRARLRQAGFPRV